MQSAERIKSAILSKDSVLVVGSDPNIKYFPTFMEQETDIINKLFTFNQIIIDSVSDYCVAIKPQLAYYEVYGSAGIQALEKIITYANETNAGVFMLVKTSNPSSGDLQDVLTKDGEPIYVKVAKLAKELTKEIADCFNIEVVGAIYPEEAKVIREILPKAYFLVPGYGA